MEQIEQVVKSILKDKNLNKSALQKMKDPKYAEEWAKAIVYFVFRNGPIQDLHNDGHLTEEDIKIVTRYMMNQMTGIIGSMQKGEWYLLGKISRSNKSHEIDWDEVDLTKFNEEKQLVIDEIARMLEKESIIVGENGQEEEFAAEERIDIQYTSSLEEETGMIQYSANIIDTGSELDVVIGEASFTQYNLALYESWKELIDIADYYSKEEQQLIAALQNLLEDEWINEKGILLHSMRIKDEFQGKGIGKLAMVKMLSYWTVMGADFAILRASPLNRKHFDIPQDKTIERLVHFYQSLGFDKMDIDQNDAEPVMISYLQ